MSDPNKKSAEELRREIEQTRANMSQTAGAIEEQLPNTLKAKAQQAKQVAIDVATEAKEAAVEQFHEAKAAVRSEVSEQVREAKYAVRRATVGRVEDMVHRTRDNMSEAGTSIVDTIRENPIPAALVGIGLAWMFMSGRSERGQVRTMRSARRHYLDEPTYDEGYVYADYEDHDESMIDRGRDAVRGGVRRARGAVNEGVQGAAEMAHDVRDRVQGVASNARRAAGDFAEHTVDRAQGMAIRAQREARHLGHEASIRARRAERGAERIFEENPLAVGAAVIAVGAMVGLALPRTEREDELMGEMRDGLVEKAERLASSTVDKAQDLAKEKLGKSENGSDGRASLPR